MEEKTLNRPVIERVATEFLGLTDPDDIEAFVNEFVYTILMA
ncbi:hypothetical protein [Eubacterium sp. 1001713B170207_170306_E7]|nr:hypothetical protein [Eubacterium sp. 1001713B170207_170306_E7]